ncbi:exonuclease domain-containing protein [Nonlabens xiamenensis]|uniref:exonuclease domain-containing protein n=1 Tax=Nonlabens xiamenensis TaxID=2341043 RepID=UPI000F6132D4|nr:exonuclease domain-containing protein [Nonlabens xiamenensis]
MYAILDVESTGGKYNEEGITEIAIYRFDGHEVVDQFASLINPERPIQPFVVKLTGISNKMLVKAPKFYEVAKRILEIMDGAILVAHNAAFDFRMLRLEFDRLGYDFSKQSLCTVELAEKLLPEETTYNLGKLCKSLGIPIPSRHRATGDAQATVKLFKMLLNKDHAKEIISKSLKTIERVKMIPNLKELVELTPSTIGVFYLFDAKERIIYIGKGKNIKKKLIQLFTNDNKRSKELQQVVQDVKFERTGSELIASLKELVEIKKHKPRFNKHPRKPRFSAGLYMKTDQNGYQMLKIQRATHPNKALTTFSSIRSGYQFLERAQQEYTLCLQKLNLEKVDDGCSAFAKANCEGACLQKEEAQHYNQKVQNLIDDYSLNGKNKLLIDKGRETGERSVVWIKDGIVAGYGFTELRIQTTDLEMLDKIITRLKPSRDHRHIVDGWLRHRKVGQIIDLDEVKEVS